MVEVIDELRRKSTMVGSLERKFVLDGISTPDEALGFAIPSNVVKDSIERII